MKRKFNWGHGILIFYVCFLGTIVFRIVASLGVDISLVVDEYYKEDLNYQEHMEKSHNSSRSDHLTYIHDKVKNKISLFFDTQETVTGEVHFYRASDKSLDFTREFSGKEFTADLSEIKKGKWKLKIEWLTEGLSHYKEVNLFI